MREVAILAVNKKNLFIRTLSGFILGPVVVFSVFTFPTTIGLVTTIVLLTAMEYFEMTLDNIDHKIKIFLSLMAAFTSAVYGFTLRTYYAGLIFFDPITIYVMSIVIVALISLFILKDNIKYKNVITSYTYALMAISLFLSYFYHIILNYGFTTGLLALTSVWVYDIGAYFVGLNIGKHKLAPVYSPKKSIEGFIGGIIFTYVYIIIFEYIREIFDLNMIDPLRAIIFAIAIGIVDTVGDLTESALKRTYNLKDSGEILPGHGGMYDRIDGVLYLAPTFYFLMKILRV
ncbi:CDP-diglyceride synthetase [Marinitoga piezophila KA3]|uniref:Phosphatidate cytidylyltransferase n=1 Tax=Marinitoga piezophila (strain DSM 14283 / JCM 11233 / KA3) TaxID=443254 RepID=H2J2T8_MARPK|nr:phosphatidate cytidylyltransferase [Marinitoga piezophila]AEX84532.1 CDP-diglyceride synthetase [Marinitoga piezophila KA3]